MAIAFAHVSIHSRSKGHSAVAAAAYRSGSKLYDDRIGKTYDFSNRSDVQYSEILLPDDSHDLFLEREHLWNEVERAENRCDAQLCKDFVLALPRELDLVQQIELAKRFARIHFVDNGVPADIAIHDHDDGNPHAHILITTRRLEYDRFSRLKARDLNPQFAKGHVVEEDYWNDKWRAFQNDYFREKEMDVTVDLDHIIPERHEGHFRHKSNHYKRGENQYIRTVRRDIVLKDIDNIINVLSIEHSVFTRRDIEKLLFKTLSDEQEAKAFMGKVDKILANKHVIYLGENEHGDKAYTTRQQFHQEARLLKAVNKLHNRKGHAFSARAVAKFLKKTTLTEEQLQAFEFIATGGDISLVVGRPGVGKSYLLKPVRQFYEKHRCRVLGAALSGKVAKQLQAESGIQSSTIASLSARLATGRLQLTKDDVLIIDEAGMVDFANMNLLIQQVKKAKAKLILVGDPDQLKPIKKGEIYRGIANHIGHFSMVDIKRQKDEGDRQASVQLAKGEVEKAIRHYHNKGAIKIADNEREEDASAQLIEGWNKSIHTADDLDKHLILSYSNAAVDSLNEQARQALKNRYMLGADEFEFQQEVGDISDKPLGRKEFVRITHTNEDLGLMGGEQAKVVKIARNGDVVIKTNDKRNVTIPAHLKAYIERTRLQEISFSQGDRVMFGRSDETIGIKNGDVGTISKINHKKMTVTLDSGQKVKVPRKYKQLNYAYAMTVHKSQGMSVENTSVLVDSSLWDRALSFVAFTRHKQSLNVYTNSYINHDMDTLSKNLSEQSIQDNVIDYPLNFGQRYGFSVDKLVSNAVKKLSQLGQKIPDKLKQVFAHEQTSFNQQQSIGDDSINNHIMPYIKEYQALIDKRKYMTGYFAEKVDKEINELTKSLYQKPEYLKQIKGLNPDIYNSMLNKYKSKKEIFKHKDL